MLALLFTLCFAGYAPLPCAPQERSAAVAVRGEAELSRAAALASAQRRAEQHLREVWRERAVAEAAANRPAWMPSLLCEQAVDRWIAALPVERLLAQVDRRDRERAHEFGSSFQTTLWVAEAAAPAARARRSLRVALQRGERAAAAKAGVLVAGWLALGVALSWIDRLSRGYMTGRLLALGALGAAGLPAVLFLV